MKLILQNQVDLLNSKIVRGVVVRADSLPFNPCFLRCVGGLWMHERVAGRVKLHIITQARSRIDLGFRKNTAYVPTMKHMREHMREALQEMQEEIESEKESEFVTRGRIAALQELQTVFSWSKGSCASALPIRHGRIVEQEVSI